MGEAGIMACLRHPKILQLYGCSLTMQAIWIVSELCIRGSLRMVLNEKSIELTLLKKLSICLDVADGMLYLHTRTSPIIHRDLKSHNIFITEPSPGHLVAKIGDWGSARAIALTGAKSMTHGVGTACWLSPEVINNAHFSKHSDVYAYGIVLWEVFTRQEIYEGLSAAQIIAKVAHEGLRPNVPRDCPWDSIMTDCWHHNPNNRPEFQAILIALSKIYLKLKSRSKVGGNNSNSNSPQKIEELLSSSTTIPIDQFENEDLIPLNSFGDPFEKTNEVLSHPKENIEIQKPFFTTNQFISVDERTRLIDNSNNNNNPIRYSVQKTKSRDSMEIVGKIDSINQMRKTKSHDIYISRHQKYENISHNFDVRDSLDFQENGYIVDHIDLDSYQQSYYIEDKSDIDTEGKEGNRYLFDAHKSSK